MKTDFNEKQVQILLIAEALFAENGFEGTSIRTIAKKAEINIAMVSYYFGSKDKLLEALILYRTSDLKIQIENLSVENLDPVEKIDKLIELYINRIRCNKGIYRILHFEFSSEDRETKMKVLNEVRTRNLKSLETIIHEGQAKGIFRKEVIIPLIPPTIMGTFFHFYMNKEYFKKLLTLETDEAFENYIQTKLKTHIQQTIKALLLYES
ncbi:transcriptional regulator, TetR family [Flavobacterium flevense]|uniref:TetR family transcriptional regulator n=1 Tax=Flavobacterium flevense TaxID=983 RepID=A0A4Y4B2E1_9FLAO|nr:TetR/AcrR family transcriptional regulator [Flavobacterium flevense]GEC72833.1 TetR family transcriptional regulator [Flavobacterium flevense]SHL87053.1 transcriptional regulator, TetR family [Flavobacterium flevense]